MSGGITVVCFRCKAFLSCDGIAYTAHDIWRAAVEAGWSVIGTGSYCRDCVPTHAEQILPVAQPVEDHVSDDVCRGLSSKGMPFVLDDDTARSGPSLQWKITDSTSSEEP